MARGRSHRRQGSVGLLFGLLLIGVLVSRPSWVLAGVAAYAHVWDAVVSPALIRVILGG